MNADDVKPWVAVAGAAAAAALIAIDKAIEANSNHKKSKQDPDYKQAMMEDSYSKALTYRIKAGKAGAGSKKRSRYTAKASKHVELALLFATQLDAEDEMPLITALQAEIDELAEGGDVAPFLMGAGQPRGQVSR